MFISNANYLEPSLAQMGTRIDIGVLNLSSHDDTRTLRLDVHKHTCSDASTPPKVTRHSKHRQIIINQYFRYNDAENCTH